MVRQKSGLINSKTRISGIKTRLLYWVQIRNKKLQSTLGEGSAWTFTQMPITLLYKLQIKLYLIIVLHSNVKIILQLTTPHERSSWPSKQMEETKHSVTILGCWISTFNQLLQTGERNLKTVGFY